MENTFPIYGWWHVDYGTFYNVNVKFVTCNAAWNYYNFVSNQVTVASLATGIVIGLPFFAIPVIGTLALGIIATAISALTFWALQGHVNTLFGDQWPYGYFWVIYIDNFYFWGLATSMSVWGPL